MGPMSQVTVVVPCYNEAARLAPAGFAPLWKRGDMHLLFVDDGSGDDTARVLAGLRDSCPERISVLRLPGNRGKAEAVRQGLLVALGAEVVPAAVGYLDADLSTPAEEMLRLIDALGPGVDAAIGARVALLGRDIRRNRGRHYLGRIFATAASLVLDVPVYDTQCGAKMFAVGPGLREALAEPFRSRWAFDVELLGRLFVAQGGRAGIVEVPLGVWRDVPGSKLRVGEMLGAGFDLVRVGVDLRRRLRRLQRAVNHRAGDEK
jgi:glycosyltransferase involved in cell wall biosynthesis